MNDNTKKARELYASELRKNRDYLKPAIDDDGEECKSFATYMVEQVEAGKLDGSAEIRAILAALSEREQPVQAPVDRIIQAARELDEELDGPPVAHKLRAAIDEYEESFRNCKHVAEVVGNEEVRHLHWSPGVNTLDFPVGTKLYTAPAAGAVPEDVLRDAERYRWLRDESENAPAKTPSAMTWSNQEDRYVFVFGQTLDDEIDAAMLASSKENPSSDT